MKLLADFDSIEEAMNLCNYLLDHGVAATVSGVNAFQHRVLSGSTRVGVWVVYEEQFNDACQLKKDSNHVVSKKISEQLLNEFKEQLDSGGIDSELGNKIFFALFVIFSVLTIFVVGAILLFRIILIE
ncbi:hypothetical protein Mag101_06630 [Microbulbifer agarilyticus]|uniref:DUF2007 domain-containing protein n=1 Tax=Microbulbifer agarilyticus TaxID=260552 RepID=A0A1Q2M3P2_9GAMM|nr:hypothetical protein [Microbulbifer agarilyticus]AQQ67345.1 hypothetical protein Mag101_06630 [Microbulbifer agarilyticus]